MPRRLVRFAAALLVLGGGAFHLSLYLDGYRSIPRIGVIFLANVVVATVLAVALLVRPSGVVTVAAVTFTVGTIGAFVLSRTTGLLGFREVGFDTRAAATLATEALSLAVLGLAFVLAQPQQPGRNRGSSRAVATPT